MRIPAVHRPLVVLIVLALVAGGASAQIVLETTFANDNFQNGNMFDIVATSLVTIRGFELNLSEGIHDIEIYARIMPGSFLGSEGTATDWTLLGAATGVISRGEGDPTPVPIPFTRPIGVGVTRAFYVTTTGSSLIRYTNGIGIGTPVAADANITVNEGIGIIYPFGLTFVNRIWNGRVLYDEGGPPMIDTGVVDIGAPSSSADGCSPLGVAETISVTVKNLGAPIPPATMIPVSYTIDGGPPILETLVTGTTIPRNGTTQFNFIATVDLSAGAEYVIRARTETVGDADASNDQAVKRVTSSPVLITPSTPFYESFDDYGAENCSADVPIGWLNDPLDGIQNWEDMYSTSSFVDSSTCTDGEGVYLVVLDSGEQMEVNINTPCLDLSAATNVLLEFDLFSQNTGMPSEENFISVDVMDVGTAMLFTDVVGPLGDQGTGWNKIQSDLTAFAGSVIQLRFRAESDNGADVHDIHIDSVSVVAYLDGPGQANALGLAEFDIIGETGGGRNDVGLPADTGKNGPFYSQGMVGGNITFRFAGTPLQPIVLFGGPLNPGVAPTPFGQVDLGTMGPMGLEGIEILGDGNAGGFLNSLFITGPGGTMELTVSIPSSLERADIAFQGIIFDPVVNLQFTSAVVSYISASTIIEYVTPTSGVETEKFKIVGANFDPANMCVLAGDVAGADILAPETGPSNYLWCELGPVSTEQAGTVRILQGSASNLVGSEVNLSGVRSGGSAADGTFDVTILGNSEQAAKLESGRYLTGLSDDSVVYPGVVGGGDLQFAITNDVRSKDVARVSLFLYDDTSKTYNLANFSVQFFADATNDVVAAHLADHIKQVTAPGFTLDAASDALGNLSVSYLTPGLNLSTTSEVTSTIRLKRGESTIDPE